MPRTPAALRNTIVGLLVVLGLVTGGVGLKVVVDAAAVDNEIRLDDARAKTQKLIGSIVGSAAEAAVASPLPNASPGPTFPSTAGPSPSPPSASASQLFASAYKADTAGNNEEAIMLYERAIAAGLQGPPLQAAQLEIGLLDLLRIQAGVDRSELALRCSRAAGALNSTRSSTDATTRDAAAKALAELVKVCPG